MELFEVKAEIPHASSEAIDEVLLEHGLANWSVLEDAIVRRAWLVGIFESRALADESWSQLQPLLTVQPSGPAATRSLGDEDWRNSYKAHFKASRFGPLHWVPVWERDTHVLQPGETAVYLDPGLAFGTGNHETTRLCAERLVTLSAALSPAEKTAARVIDAGCGSGILALSAIRLGYRDVSAFDNDPEAVRISEENATLNGLSGAVQFSVGDLTSSLGQGTARVVLANIQADVLMRFARELTAAVAPGGHLILSGILAHENEAVRNAFAPLCPTWKTDHRTLGEWSDVLLSRPPST
ncbi:50S ribosomal protein L11 methyltransferase [Nibricoccus sp. IMCC34717]|uniref:50S ribosomal protein L11 methyltransferase n=1 Tax=Nibricoccus sp. IMCC34717 TaxID=3034021 RepID=UPI00384E1E75